MDEISIAIRRGKCIGQTALWDNQEKGQPERAVYKQRGLAIIKQLLCGTAATGEKEVRKMIFVFVLVWVSGLSSGIALFTGVVGLYKIMTANLCSAAICAIIANKLQNAIIETAERQQTARKARK